MTTILEAARLMQRLNVLVHDAESADRRLIYSLKTALIWRLYHEGYCVAALKETRHMTCACRLRGFRGGCARCGYTGQRDVVLYRFNFDIGGERFVWHQPERQVTWPVVQTKDVPESWQQTALAPVEPAELPVLLDQLLQWYTDGGGVLTEHG